MDGLLQDLRYALRTLARAPGFTAVAILTLAIGIGANTAIFSAVHTVLLKPLPYPESDRLVEILSSGYQNTRFGVSYPDLHDLRGMTQDFIGVGASTTQRYNLTGAGDPREVEAAAVTADLFTVLQVHPEIGRLLTPQDERAPVALIGHGLWATNFGSDRGIVGKPIALDGKSYTVIGVMPAEFHFPRRSIEVWTPVGDALAQNPRAETDRGYHFFNAVARLAPGITMARVAGDLSVLAARINAADSVASAGGPVRRQIVATGAGPVGPPPGGGGRPAAQGMFGNGFAATLLRDAAIGDVRGPLFIMLGAVGLVLLIACANAANLLLARAAARRREMAVRRALGAARGRLMRQLLTESVLLALAAGAVGILLASWGLHTLLGIWPRALPRSGEIGLDGPVLIFTVGLAAVTGIVFGLVPAWRAASTGIEEALREDAAGATGGRRHRLQSGLVITEVALSLVLLVGAGLLVRSFIRLNNVNPGFDTRDVVAARIRLTPTRYPDGPGQAQFFDNMLTVLQSRPGVQNASIAGTLPLSGMFRMLAFDPRSVRPDYPQPFMVLRSFVVSPAYFSAFRIPLREGRAFTADDRATAPHVAVMNRAAVAQLWPGQDPIGKQLTIGRPGGGGAPITIVGVIDNLRSSSLDAAPQPEIYTPAAQEGQLDEMWVVFRAGNGRPLEMTGVIRDAVRQADAEQPIGEIASLSNLADQLTAARRFNMTLLTLFAILALGLALVGIYGVTAYAVTQRTRELGIRLALGARPDQVVGLLVRENLRRVTIGVVFGLVAAFGATRVLKTLLYEVAPSDALTFSGTAVLLAAVALAATWWPARRATRVDPIVALRTE